MRLLVCGGRGYRDHDKVDEVMAGLHYPGGKITHLIQGGATGADTLAAKWAAYHRIPCVLTYYAQWGKHGRKAGPIRNRLMLTDGMPDLVVAFPGGRGTANMVSRAHEAGVRVMQIRDDR